MATDYQKNPIVDLSAGLVTEQTPFTLIPNATRDELNCSIENDGSRIRRPGIAFEEAFDDDTVYPLTGPRNLIWSTTWYNAGDIGGNNILIVQVQNKLYFYQVSQILEQSIIIDPSTSEPLVITLGTYRYNGLDSNREKISSTSINGMCIITSPSIYPFYIKVDNSSASGYSHGRIDVKFRDFKYLGDTSTYFSLANLGGTATVAKQRRMYDTINSGWTEPTLEAYETAKTASDYPPLTHRWYSGKDASGNFLVAEWDKLYASTSIVGNGRIILDVLERDRVTAYNALSPEDTINTTYIPDEIEPSSFSTATSFSGRIFYAGLVSGENSSVIYFTKVIERIEDLGTCYQINDPTSELFSDPLDSDGGTIKISDCHVVQYMVPFQNDLLVFATNGVWAIRGVDGRFSPTSYFLEKITNEGVVNRFCVTTFNQTPIAFGIKSIFTILRQSSSNLTVESLTDNRIKRFINNITNEQKRNIFAVSSEREDKIFWIYQDVGEVRQSKYNNLLVYDLRFGAFTPWRISDNEDSESFICSGFSYSNATRTESFETLVDDSGDDIIDSNGDFLSINSFNFFQTENIKFVSYHNGFKLSGGPKGFRGVRFAEFRWKGFQDWPINSVGADYDSYMETSYDTFGDLHNLKTVNSITVYHKIPDVGYISAYLAEDDFVLHTSSLLVKPFWDFKTSTTLSTETYYERETPTIQYSSPTTTPWVYPISHTYKQVMLEGRGRILNLRFEATSGKDFILIGYENIGLRNREYDNPAFSGV